MKRKKDEIAVPRDEAQMAKRALQYVLDDLEELKLHAATGSTIARLNGLQGKIRVAITALRDADTTEASKRGFE
jgi:hypothetical protein